MKKKLPFYILFVFLIIVNVFFLFNYLGRPGLIDQNHSKSPANFLIEELGFSESQISKIETINIKQHQNMMSINMDIRRLKDVLFSHLSAETINDGAIDSIANLISVKQKEMEKTAFYHFRSIQEICNTTQKAKFKKIMKDAIHRGKDGRNNPPQNEENRNGPPSGMEDRPGPPPPPPGR